MSFAENSLLLKLCLLEFWVELHRILIYWDDNCFHGLSGNTVSPQSSYHFNSLGAHFMSINNALCINRGCVVSLLLVADSTGIQDATRLMQVLMRASIKSCICMIKHDMMYMCGFSGSWPYTVIIGLLPLIDLHHVYCMPWGSRFIQNCTATDGEAKL